MEKLRTELEKGRTFSQYNYEWVSKLEWDDTRETVNIKSVQALQRRGMKIEWTIKQA